MIPSYGSLQSLAYRFDWLFEKEYYWREFIALVFEGHIVDQVIVVDSIRWPSLTHDSYDLYPITLSSPALFHCTGPGANKFKIVDLYEVFRRQRKYEISDDVEQEIFTLPQGSAPPV